MFLDFKLIKIIGLKCRKFNAFYHFYVPWKCIFYCARVFRFCSLSLMNKKCFLAKKIGQKYLQTIELMQNQTQKNLKLCFLCTKWNLNKSFRNLSYIKFRHLCIPKSSYCCSEKEKVQCSVKK